MNLEDKLTSREAVVEALRTGYDNFDRVYHILSGLHNIEPAWWAVREQARLRKGVYQTTEALESVNRHAKVFAHISTTDKTKVAFTPDKSFGERDAQLMMNFGKFVQRVIPFASDEYVKQLTESHTAELSDEVEWITGPEIANVYATTSLTSCMTSKAWGMANPALAYDAPGIKLAVLRDTAGNINARCMVYEDGDDKRLIRNYGDGKLLKRLKRLGYTAGGWQGVKFNTLTEPDADGLVKVAIPYLDSMNSTATAEHCTVVLLDGVLQGVKSRNRAALTAAGVSQTVANSTQGYLLLRSTSSQEFTKKDIVTGEDINLLTDKVRRVMVNGDLGLSKVGFGEEYVEARYLAEGSWETAWMLKAETYMHAGTAYLDSDDERHRHGYGKLSTKFYPEATDWVRTSFVTTRVDGEEHRIRAADSVMLYEADGTKRPIHNSQTTKEHTRVADQDGTKWYAAKGVEIIRTPSKAKVLRGVHAIDKGWKGWDYSRNLQVCKHLFGSVVYGNRKDANTQEFKDYCIAIAKGRIAETVKSQGENLARAFRALCSTLSVNLGYVYPASNCTHFKRPVYGYSASVTQNLETFKEYLECLSESCHGDCIELKTMVSHLRMMIAEAEATNGEEPQPIVEIEALKLVIAEREAVAA